MRKPYAQVLTGRIGHALATGLVAAVLLLLSLAAQAQQGATSLFSDNAGARQAAAASALATELRASRPLTLDVPGMRAALATAPQERRAGTQPLLLTLPLPDGSNAAFRIRESSVMEPALAAKYPELKTYVGVGVNDPSATVRLDFTPAGFHAQVLSGRTGDFFIDPASRADVQHYLSFWKRDMPGKSFDCGTEAKGSSVLPRPAGSGQQLRTIAPTLRTFRLAVAATGEYTATQGGTVASGLAAIVTAVNRVVGVYERELDVRLVLVANNDQLVYTNAATDPYTNSNGSTMLGQNQTNVTNIIGTANYDIGHVFSTGGGGVAGLGVVCRSTVKARGVTGLPNPTGDAFYIDYVAHEMGHQFGANHPFNSVMSNCGGGNRSALHAYEPGSGSTIMAYAGICGTDDLQPHSDAYFHVESYEEIQAYLATQATCGTSAATGDTAPVVTLPASGKVLPISTPFKLTAVGSDADGDALTYCWEQYDLGPGAALTAPQVAGQNVPLFRSFSPTADPTRYFPRLSDLLSNTSSLAERLPTVTRALTFRVTLRDAHDGDQGVVGGLNSSANVALSSTSAAGPFLVTAPNTSLAWAPGSTQAVTWNVAGTTGNGVNCATVNIRLSTDGGLTYPTLLAANTPNDGSEAVVVPNLATTTARIMVEAADNYFFDISDRDFAISTTPVPVACSSVTSLVFSNITATTATLSFQAGSLNGSYTVSTTPATTTQMVSTSPVNLTGLVGGTTYTVRVASTCTDGSTTTATASFTTVPAPVVAPANDECAGAIALTSGTTCTALAGTFVGATQSQPASTCSGYVSASANDVWYSFVATGSTHTITTGGSADGVLEVFSGSCGSLSSLGCVDASTNETITLRTFTAGTRYYVRYYPYATSATDAPSGTFTICVTAPAPVLALQVQYQTGDLGQATDNVVRPYLQLVSTGTAAVSYSELTMRYWLTIENYNALEPRIDWAKLGTDLVSVRYVALATPRQGAFGYLEYAFAAGAGTLDAGANSGPILSSMHKQNWTDMDETNDYSFVANASYAANPRITLYRNGTLLYGTEPAALTASTAVKVYAGNQDLSPTTQAISVYLQVGNTGTTPVNYADLKVRYWFTPDEPRPLTYEVNYAPLGSGNFSLQTGQKDDNTYAELSFASALGTLNPASNTGNIQFRIRRQDWSTTLVQTNDYSFRPSAAIEEQPRITAYLGGQLVWGTEPTSSAAPAARDLAKGTLDNPFGASPNPFADELRLRFTLANAEAYTLSVYDAQGRLVEELPAGTAAAGQPQELTWPASRCAAGLYLVRLRSASTLQYLRVMKQ